MAVAAVSCQTIQEEASLTLVFNMTQPLLTRSGAEGAAVLDYVVKDGEITVCGRDEAAAYTRAGNGNPADGGGMSDLNVFLVDNADDNIVARKRISDMGNATSLSLNFLNLPVGEYCVYAYANAEDNDWFRMPSEDEISFTPYKDTLLKSLNDGIPTVSNNRMPLTGRQVITLEGGNDSRTVEMLRPVGKLTMTIFNERDEGLDVQTPEMGEILPSAGYVFKHDEILPRNDTSNPYHAFHDGESHSVVPGSYHVVYETLLYETNVSGGLEVSVSYEGNNYTFQKNLSNRLQDVKQEDLLIKLYKESWDTSEDRFLKLDQAEGGYEIKLVCAHELGPECFWRLSSSGRQQRGLTNVFYGMYLNMDDGILSFSSQVQTFKYDGSVELKQIPVMIEDLTNNTMVPLTSICRNQHIKVNIIFR